MQAQARLTIAATISPLGLGFPSTFPNVRNATRKFFRPSIGSMIHARPARCARGLGNAAAHFFTKYIQRQPLRCTFSRRHFFPPRGPPCVTGDPSPFRFNTQLIRAEIPQRIASASFAIASSRAPYTPFP